MSTLDGLIGQHADTRPDALALIDVIGSDDSEPRADGAIGEVRLTWAELADAVDRVAGVLLGHGVRDNEVVSTLLPVGVDALVTQLAVVRIAATLVCREPSALAGIDEPTVAVVATTHTLDRFTSRGALQLRAGLPALRLVLVWGGPREGAVWLDPEVTSGRDRDLVARHRNGHASLPGTVLGPAASGATHQQVLAAGAVAANRHDLRWDDVLLDAAPTLEPFLGQCGAAWLASGCTLAMAGALPAPALWELAARTEATVVAAPATALVPIPALPLVPVRLLIATTPGPLDDVVSWGTANRTTVALWDQPGLG